jgi:hypothetical protein
MQLLAMILAMIDGDNRWPVLRCAGGRDDDGHRPDPTFRRSFPNSRPPPTYRYLPASAKSPPCGAAYAAQRCHRGPRDETISIDVCKLSGSEKLVKPFDAAIEFSRIRLLIAVVLMDREDVRNFDLLDVAFTPRFVWSKARGLR